MTTNDATLNTGTFSAHVYLGDETFFAQTSLSYTEEEKEIMIDLLVENMPVAGYMTYSKISHEDPEFSERIRQALIDSCPEHFRQNPEAIRFHPQQVVFPEEIYSIAEMIIAEMEDDL